MELRTLISSQVASPVNLSVMLEEEPGRMTTVTSGLKCVELLEMSDPLGCLLKMLTGSSVWHNPIVKLSWKTRQLYARKRKWSSKPLGKTLKKLDINPSQLLFQLQVSARCIGDTGSSFWATPSAADAVGSHGGGKAEVFERTWRNGRLGFGRLRGPTMRRSTAR